MTQNSPLAAQAAQDLPLLALRDVVVYPQMQIALFVGRPKSIRAVEEARQADDLVFVVAQKDSLAEGIDNSNLYEYGTVCRIVQVVNHENDDNCIKVLIEGLHRAHLDQITNRIIADVIHGDSSEAAEVATPAQLGGRTIDIDDG